jgi:hypothetical protein
MKRMTILVAVAALFVSTATIALAGDAEDGAESVPEASEVRELNETQMWKVILLADYWLSGSEAEEDSTEGTAAEPGPTIEDEIVALRTGEIVVGWGAMFKLMQLAKAHPATTLSALVEQIKDADEGWAFGRRFKELDDGQSELARPEGSAKNFGQLKKLDRVENGTHTKKPKKP